MKEESRNKTSYGRQGPGHGMGIPVENQRTLRELL